MSRSYIPLAISLVLLCGPAGSAAALEPTPAQTEGPYYPRSRPADTDADLTRIGSGPLAKGTVLVLDARVVDLSGKPIEAARVEIWQTDAQGIYMHPDDSGFPRRDQAFQFYGEARSDAEGKLRFTTIRPPPYSGRPAHIHVKITPQRGATLTTQLYFADDQGLGRDGIVRRLGKALERVTLRPVAGGTGQLTASIELVTARGRPK